jgi:hypothetical protein
MSLAKPNHASRLAVVELRAMTSDHEIPSTTDEAMTNRPTVTNPIGELRQTI